MIDLKTLKDIPPANEFDRNKFSVRQGTTKLYCEEDLRGNAIKWIKKLEESNSYENNNGIDIIDGDLLRKFGAEDLLRMKSIVFWIEHFFNIEDCDLK